MEYGHTEQEYDLLVNEMCDYAFTGYETAEIPVE